MTGDLDLKCKIPVQANCREYRVLSKYRKPESIRSIVTEQIEFNLKTTREKKHKVTWYENRNQYQKSGPTDFRYCPIVSFRKVKTDVPIQTAEEIARTDGRTDMRPGFLVGL